MRDVTIKTEAVTDDDKSLKARREAIAQEALELGAKRVGGLASGVCPGLAGALRG